MVPTPDFLSVTELADDQVSREQVARAYHRYAWAREQCAGKDVLEVACGNGQGLGLLASVARSVQAGDIEPALVERVARHFGPRVDVRAMDAEELPVADASLDVVILFEALYYIPRPERFVAECRRVLRPGGALLICSANKDMADFNPSPYAQAYHGVVELGALLAVAGLEPAFYGAWSYAGASAWQRALVPVKRLAVVSGLMPRTMDGKRLLKRLVFGKLVTMPRELAPAAADYAPPIPIPAGIPDRTHRVIYCVARRR